MDDPGHVVEGVGASYDYEQYRDGLGTHLAADTTIRSNPCRTSPTWTPTSTCYALDGANVAIVQEFSAHLALMFFKGVLLEDPAGVLEEVGPNSHAARRMTFRSVDDVRDRADLVAAYVEEAIAVERSGRTVPPRPEDELADELRNGWPATPTWPPPSTDSRPVGAVSTTCTCPPRSGPAPTRERRVDQIVPRLLDGGGLRDR